MMIAFGLGSIMEPQGGGVVSSTSILYLYSGGVFDVIQIRLQCFLHEEIDVDSALLLLSLATLLGTECMITFWTL